MCMHHIYLDKEIKPVRQAQRRLNPKMEEVVDKEALKLLHNGFIYPISDSEWVSPVHVVPKKGGFTIEENEKVEMIAHRPVVGWRVCIDYRKLNEATKKDHFTLPFLDQCLDKLAGKEYFCFLNGYSGYHQVPIAPEDQAQTTFTCPKGTFSYRRMPFGLCNAPAMFQRCMYSIFSELLNGCVEVFMDDFSVHGNSFEKCAENLEEVLQRCEETNLALNWENAILWYKKELS